MCLITSVSFAEEDMTIQGAEELFEATKIVCNGISDEISHVSKISKVNTAVTAAGTNVATGLVETGLNISLITLTKNLMSQAGRCEEVLQ
mgnify:CR=1 FL=1